MLFNRGYPVSIRDYILCSSRRHFYTFDSASLGGVHAAEIIMRNEFRGTFDLRQTRDNLPEFILVESAQRLGADIA